ncbi:mucin TcMUCII [Trypanosoma cruzi cruzi]|uniref:Putative mucin TcMUCII n=1 Tax=Trypanosoma cruzi TaxID=5693 RepID=A0A2V2W3U1_TRYCR|nr:mucin TcMUCII [Trypanosoma cruzi cruzi]PWV03326.1 putative mucin TcMUCII [Trypanosoma cruzi]
MMTCRLLCALLVLALCCCPSVCVTADGEKDVNISVQPPVQPGVQTPSSTQLQSDISGVTRPKGNSDTTQVQNQASGGGGSENSLLTPSAPAGESVTYGPKGSTVPETGSTQETDAMTGAGVLQIKPGNEESPDSRTVTAPSTTITTTTTESTTTNTTTTTTQAPSTTTTTTTTQAPIGKATTTEAPTTTTTRAPSRLREIDGSLSSSAWVCAPLLLAASALAYTTLV